MAASPYKSFSRLKTIFTPDKRGTELDNNIFQLVIFAELVLQDGLNELADECIGLFFTLNPPTNQFVIRAYLCQSQAIAPTNTLQTHKLLECLKLLAKAVNIAKKSQCYHFLVYNASVIMWKIIRPFSRPNYCHLYSNMLQHIIKALDEVKETDYQWRLSLMIILIKSQLANNQLDEANKTAQSILQLVRQQLPSLIIQTHKHICECGLNDVKGSDRDIKKHPQLQILLRIWKLKCHISIGDFEHKLGRIYHQLAEGSSDSSLQTDNDDMPTHTIYIEMAELAMQGSCYDLANKCIEAINIDDSMELYNRYQLLKGQLMVASLAPDDYTPSAIQLRQNAITLCEEVLKSCTDKNSKDESLIEPTCVVIWNLSLPLLQPPLRLFLYRPLTAIINALSIMDSVLDVLRFNVHSELVKISSDMSNTDGAITHVDSAMKLIEHDKRDHVRSLMFIKRRLELKKELYITPTDPLDQAIQLMEQLLSSELTDNVDSLLITVGDLLTDRKFSTLLSYNPAAIIEEGNEDLIRLACKREKIKCYKDGVAANQEGADDDMTKCWVWFQLAAFARKTKAWDVAILSSLYCTAYDDDRWQYSHPTDHPAPVKKTHSELTKKRSSSLSISTPDHASIPSNSSFIISQPVDKDKQILQSLAQTHFIYGECLVHILQEEGVGLGECLNPNKFGLTMDQTQDESWLSHCDWINGLTEGAHDSFIRGAEIGIAIHEDWLVYNSAVYLWNYHQHLLINKDTHRLVAVYRKLYQNLKLLDCYNGVLCQIAGVLANGLVVKWKPSQANVTQSRTGSGSSKKKSGRTSGGSGSKNKGKKRDTTPSGVHPDSINDLKESLEICEFVMNKFNTVELSIRWPLLKEWTLVKYLLQQPISLSSLPFDVKDDSYSDNCQAIIAVDMCTLMHAYSSYDFPNTPQLPDILDMITSCHWDSNDITHIQLELYTRLATTANIDKNIELVIKCCHCALDLTDEVDLTNKFNCSLLAAVNVLMGQSQNDLSIALTSYVNSTRFGCKAGDYQVVIQGCRYAWNSSSSNNKDREMLLEPFQEMMSNLMSLAGRRSQVNPVELGVDDLKLMMDMYNVIFQIYTDKNEWTGGLEAVESALWVSPKSLFLFLTEHKIMFKSHLGGSIEGEMMRFQDENPLTVAKLWLKIAQNSTKADQTLICYEKAIDLLDKVEDDDDGCGELKLQYMMELIRWMYNNDYGHDDVMNRLLMAVQLCTTDTIHGLDNLLQLHVMMSQCSCHSQLEYITKCVEYILLIWKSIASYESMEGWSSLTLSNEQIAKINDDQSNDNIPSKKTILKPLLTVHYMEVLVDALILHDLHLLTLPVIQLELLLSQHVIHSQVLAQYTQLRLSVMCQELNLPHPIVMNDIRAQDVGDVRLKSTMISSSNNNNNSNNISCSVITDEVCTWRIWVKMADILLSQGLYQSAIEYLNEAKHISKAYGDTDTLANILLCETKLALFERKYQAAIDILMESNSLPCTYDTWCKIIDCYTTAVTNSDQLMILLTEALATVKIVLANKPHHLLLITTILTLKMSVVDGTSSDDDNIEKNIQLLCDNGYTTIAVEILTSLAQRCNGMTHNDIITSIKWCRMAISILRERYEHVVSASQPNTQVMVLPIQRLLVKCHLVLVKYLLEVLRKNHDVSETHKKLKQDKRSIEKLIDDYLQEPSSSDPDEQQWNDLSNVAGDEGLSLINSCYGLCGNDSHLQTKCLCCLGQLLAVTSRDVAPDIINEWAGESFPSDTPLNHYSTLSTVMRRAEAVDAQVMESLSLNTLSHAVQVLLTAINYGLNNQQLDIVQMVSLELVNIFGNYDPSMSSIYLSLYQSCVTSQYLHGMLTQTFDNPMESKLSTLLRQYESSSSSHLPSHKACHDALKKYECWNRLRVEPNYMELTKSFHYNVRFLILQHSPDGCHLYSSYMLPPQPALSAPKRAQNTITTDQKPPVVLISAVNRCQVLSDDLKDLLLLFKQYKQDVALASRQCELKNEEMLQSQFEGVISALEAYLSDSIALFNSCLEKEDANKELAVVLLIDKELAELPIEAALSCLRKRNVKKVSRDFSLQMLHHRIVKMYTANGEADEDVKKTKHHVQPSLLLANTVNFKYILDPRNDLQSNNGSSYCSEIKTAFSSYSKLTAKWAGYSGWEQPISYGQWSSLLQQNASGLIIACSEKCLNHCHPKYLAPLNLSNVSLTLVMDLLSTASSYRHQAKLDALKNEKEREMESSLKMAMILSLVGVSCIYCHQWNEECNTGIQQLIHILNDLLSKGLHTGQIHWLHTEDSTGDTATGDTAGDNAGPSLPRDNFNGIVYGLPHITLLSDN